MPIGVQRPVVDAREAQLPVVGAAVDGEHVALGIGQDGEHVRARLGVDGRDVERLAVEAEGARAAGGEVAVVGGVLAGDAGDGEAHGAGGEVVDAEGARHVVLDAQGAEEARADEEAALASR